MASTRTLRAFVGKREFVLHTSTMPEDTYLATRKPAVFIGLRWAFPGGIQAYVTHEQLAAYAQRIGETLEVMDMGAESYKRIA
jgi:hypothetical protein